MATEMIIIVKNNSGIAQAINDLGISIANGSQRNLTSEFSDIEIAESKDLKSKVQSATLVINDGTKDLSVSEALKIFNEVLEPEVDPIVGSQDLDMKDFKIINVGTAANSGDVTNKLYVDTLLYTVSGQLDWVPKNTVLIEPDEIEIIGKRYHTINNALTYISTQTPAASSRWDVEVGGLNSENFTLPEFVSIYGKNSTTLSGIVSIGPEPITDAFHYVIKGCTITNLMLDIDTRLWVKDCIVSGGSLSGTLIALNSFFVLGSFGDLTSDLYFINCTIDNGTYNGSCNFAQCTLNSPILNGGYYSNCFFNAGVIFNMGTYSIMGGSMADEAITITSPGSFSLTNISSTNTTITVSGGQLFTYSGNPNVTFISGIWNNYGDLYDNRLSKLSSIDFQGAVDELHTLIMTSSGAETLSQILEKGNQSGGHQIDMQNQRIINVEVPINSYDSTNRYYVDTLVTEVTAGGIPLSTVLSKGNQSGGNQIDMQSERILNLDDPVSPVDAANKRYVTTIVEATSAQAALRSEVAFKDANVLVVKKTPNVGEFSSIAAAIATIVDASSANPYIVSVGPGDFFEPLIIVPSFVSIKGTSIATTIVIPDADNHDVFQVNPVTEISFLTISETGAGYAGVNANNCGNWAQLHKVSLYNCDIGVLFNVNSVDSQLFLEYVDFDEIYSEAINITTTSSFYATCNIENTYTYPIEGNVAVNQIKVDGQYASLTVLACGINGNGNDNGIRITNGGSLDVRALFVFDCNTGIYADTVGTNPSIRLGGISFHNNSLYNFNIANSTATGSYTGASEYLKNIINNSNSFFITNRDARIITVAKKGGDFTSVATAVAYATGASSTDPYIISVGPGIFSEPLIDLPSYVYLKGSTIEATIIEPDTANHDVIKMEQNTDISFATIQNAGAGFAGINATDCGNFAQLHKVSIYNCDIGIYYEASTVDSQLYLEYVDIDEIYSEAISIVANSGFEAFCNAENTYTYPTIGNTATNQIRIDGSNAILYAGTCGIQGNTTGNGFLITNGGSLYLKATDVIDNSIGVYADTNGTNPTIQMNGVDFRNDTINFNIANTTAIGDYTGYTEYTKQSINTSNSFFTTNKDSQIITVAKKGGDFTSIKAAVDNISDASSSKPYTVEVGPGTFIEDTITMKQYVNIAGKGPQDTIIQVDTPTKTAIIAAANAELKDLQVAGATGAGGIGILASNLGSVNPFRLTTCDLGSNETLISVISTVAFTLVKTHNCLTGGLCDFTNGCVVSSTNPVQPAVLIVDSWGFLDVASPFLTGALFKAVGSGAQLVVSNTLARSAGGTGDAISVEDGAELRVISGTFRGFNNGLNIKNVGSAPLIRVTGTNFEANTTYDLLVSHPSAYGSITCAAEMAKVYVNPSSTISITYADSSISTTTGSVTVGDIYQGTRHDRLINLSKLTTETSAHGLISGGTITKSTTGGNFAIDITGGNGFLDSSDGYVKEVTWNAITLTLAASSTQYVIVNDSGVVTTEPTVNYSDLSKIVLGYAFTTGLGVHYVDDTPVIAKHMPNNLDTYTRAAIGPIYVSGSTVTETATAELIVTAGNRYYGTNNFPTSGGTPILFEEHWQTSPGVFHHGLADSIVVNTTQYDAGLGTLTNISSGYYAKHSLYVEGDNVYGTEKYLFVFSQAQYSSLVVAEGASIPTPPKEFPNSATLIASLITQQGNSHIAEIRDERPVIGFKASGVSSTAYHSGLLGLDADDHKQYLLVNGTRAMAGALDMGNYNINNAGTINSVTITTHESRHLPNGSDPLTTAAPVTNLGGTVTNAVGTANSFARSDHTHAINTASPSMTGLVTPADWNTFNNSYANSVTYTNSATASLKNYVDANDYWNRTSATGTLSTRTAGDKVLLNTSSKTYAPLILTPNTSTPTTELSGGSLMVQDNRLWIYDTSRSKWLSMETMPLEWANNGNSDGVSLQFGGNLAVTNSGPKMPYDGAIVAVTAQATNSITKQIDVYINNAVSFSFNLLAGPPSSYSTTTQNTNFSAGDYLSVFVNAALGNVANLAVVLWVKWRL